VRSALKKENLSTCLKQVKGKYQEKKHLTEDIRSYAWCQSADISSSRFVPDFSCSKTAARSLLGYRRTHCHVFNVNNTDSVFSETSVLTW